MSLPTPDEKHQATRTDVEWLPIPGFSEYDAGSNNRIRRRTTNNMVRKSPTGLCQMKDDSGVWRTRSYGKMLDQAWNRVYNGKAR